MMPAALQLRQASASQARQHASSGGEERVNKLRKALAESNDALEKVTSELSSKATELDVARNKVQRLKRKV